jgi:DNA-directed RNA polymerase specialized sigma24 family protein
MTSPDSAGSGFPAPRHFCSTHWSVVLKARQTGSSEAQEALAWLCEHYWYPLYAFVRRKGHDPDAARDLTQAFFARLLEKDTFGEADPARGRFRTFLLAALQNFVANAHDHDRALKRGGGQAPVRLDWGEAESRYGSDVAHEMTAEKLFLRRWALTLLDRVLQRLRAEYAEDRKEKLFEAIKPFLVGNASAETYAEVGQRLKLNEGAVKVAVHRMRRRYRELLRAEILETVEDPQAVDSELRDLFEALR